MAGEFQDSEGRKNEAKSRSPGAKKQTVKSAELSRHTSREHRQHAEGSVQQIKVASEHLYNERLRHTIQNLRQKSGPSKTDRRFICQHIDGPKSINNSAVIKWYPTKLLTNQS